MDIESQWFGQKDGFANAAAIVHNLIHLLNVKISKRTIYNELMNEPGYPSLNSIESFFKKWEFDTMISKMEISLLNKVEFPLITWMQENNYSYYVILIQCKENEILYLSSERGWISESLDVFAPKWTRYVLDVLPSKSSYEIDFENKEYLEKIESESNINKSKVSIVENFLSLKECQHIINIATSKFERSTTVKRGGGHQIDKGRTSYSAYLNIKDEIIESIYDRASKLLDINNENFEHLQCTSYEKNQEYRVHHDAFEETEKKELERGGQRISTILIYLNDDYKGGETFFPMIDVRVKPKVGSVAIWNHLLDNGDRDSDAYHAGLPVLEGRKYVGNLWLRSRNTNRKYNEDI